MAKKLYGAAAAAHAKRLARGRRSSSKAITHVKHRTVTHHRSVGGGGSKRGRRRGHRGGGFKLTHLALATAGLAFVTGQSSPVTFIRDNAAKIPGAKTFGTSAALGVACLAVDRFVKPNKWLKLMGTAGIVLAAAKIGEQGTAFKWVGDDGMSGPDGYDLADDDVSDLEDVGDDE